MQSFETGGAGSDAVMIGYMDSKRLTWHTGGLGAAEGGALSEHLTGCWNKQAERG